MAVKHADLEPGWLRKTLDAAAAYERGQDKIIAASDRLRQHGTARTTVTVEFTEVELHELAYMAKLMRPVRS